MNGKLISDCNEIRIKLPAYINDILPEDEMKLIDVHLKSCDSCRKHFEDSENKNFLKSNRPFTDETRKMELKLAKRISVRMITICVLVLVAVYIILTAIPQTILSKALNKKQQEIGYALQDIVQFTIPGARIKSGWRGKIGIVDIVNVIEYEQKLIGGGVIEGKLDLAVPIYLGENDWRKSSTYEHDDLNMGYPGFTPIMRDENYINSRWAKLAEVQNWTQSRISLNFENPVSITEMDDIIAKTGITADNNMWFGIDTSKLNLNKWGYHGLALLQAQWGFPIEMQLTEPEESRKKKDANGNVVSSVDVKKDSEGNVSSISELTCIDEKHRVSQVLENYRKEMKSFINYSKYFKDNEFTSDLKKVNEIIQKDDFKIAGFIIEGPTSMLLKLKDYRNISRVDIIKVDFDYMR